VAGFARPGPVVAVAQKLPTGRPAISAPDGSGSLCFRHYNVAIGR
jgi:hypothetical protein